MELHYTILDPRQYPRPPLGRRSRGIKLLSVRSGTGQRSVSGGTLTKRWIVPVLVLAATVAALAQPWDDAVSLEARLPELEGLERARALARLTEIYRGEAAEKAIVYGEEALEILAHTPDRPAEVTTRNELAWAYMVRGELQRAEALAREGRKLARQIGDRRGEARAASNLGVIVGTGGDPLQAVELFTEALGTYRSIGARAGVAMSLNNLGYVHTSDLTDYRLALEYQLEALAIRQELGDQRDIALSLTNLGFLYHRLDRREQAREHYSKALAIRRELGIQHRVASTLHSLGDLAMDEEDFEAALDYHREALAIRQAIGEQFYMPMSRRSLAFASAGSTKRRSTRRKGSPPPRRWTPRVNVAQASSASRR